MTTLGSCSIAAWIHHRFMSIESELTAIGLPEWWKSWGNRVSVLGSEDLRLNYNSIWRAKHSVFRVSVLLAGWDNNLVDQERNTRIPFASADAILAVYVETLDLQFIYLSDPIRAKSFMFSRTTSWVGLDLHFHAFRLSHSDTHAFAPERRLLGTLWWAHREKKHEILRQIRFWRGHNLIPRITENADVGKKQYMGLKKCKGYSNGSRLLVDEIWDVNSYLTPWYQRSAQYQGTMTALCTCFILERSHHPPCSKWDCW